MLRSLFTFYCYCFLHIFAAFYSWAADSLLFFFGRTKGSSSRLFFVLSVKIIFHVIFLHSSLSLSVISVTLTQQVCLWLRIIPHWIYTLYRAGCALLSHDIWFEWLTQNCDKRRNIKVDRFIIDERFFFRCVSLFPYLDATTIKCKRNKLVYNFRTNRHVLSELWATLWSLLKKKITIMWGNNTAGPKNYNRTRPERSMSCVWNFCWL